jgi:peptidoglycan-associated lipoprotein
MVGFVLVTACPKKPPKPKVAPQDTAPTVSMPPPPTTTTTETKVENTDFVKPSVEPTVTSEPLPSNVEDLNRVAQQKGYIQDAFFGLDESALSGDAQAALNASATWLKEHSEYNILVEGHCDERGTEQYNLALGDRRANIAKQYLQTLGVDGSRIRTVSYGEERPFDAGHDESSWAKNRRAHLVIVGK